MKTTEELLDKQMNTTTDILLQAILREIHELKLSMCSVAKDTSQARKGKK
jgi:hypothetical protein